MPRPSPSTEIENTARPGALLGTPMAVLAVSTFAMGLSEFIVIGLIARMISSFAIDLSDGALFVAAYAIGISLGAPILTIATLNRSTRLLSALLLGGFAITSLGCANSTAFVIFLGLRFTAGALHGAYFSIVTSSLATLYGRTREPMALALMFSGLTVAMVLGVPAGMAVAEILGWQAPFLLIGALSGVCAIAAWFVLPNHFGAIEPLRRSPASKHSSLALLWPYTFTVFGFGGGFVFMTFAEPWLKSVAGLSDEAVYIAFGAIGVGALIGNILGGALPTRIGRATALSVAILLQLVGLFGLGFATTILPPTLLLLFFAIGAFATAPMVHGWAISLAGQWNPRFASSLNVTGFNVGLSASALIAAWHVDLFGLPGLPITAALFVGLALPICAIELVAARQSRMNSPSIQTQ